MVKSEIIDLNVSELQKYIASKKDLEFLLVDVRQPKEYTAGHIPGAVLIPLKDIEARITELDKDRELIFYCRSGKRSKAAATLVEGSGIVDKNIYNLQGGILAWNGKKLEGFPSVQPFIKVDDLPSLLEKAMEFEKGAERFYTICSEHFQDSSFTPLAKTLAKLELGHARVIYGLLSKASTGELPPFNQMYDQIKGDVLEGGIPLEEAFDRFKSIKKELCINFVEMALDIEYNAYDLYRYLAGHFHEPEMFETLLLLANQEKGHIRVVAGGLDVCNDSL